MSGKNVLLVGTGQMALEYHKSLTRIGINPTVVGNSRSRAEKFAEKTGVEALLGSITGNLDFLKTKSFDLCFVAVSEPAIREVLKDILTIDCKKVIVEKPGAASPEDLKEIESLLGQRCSKDFFIAYNRRFYRSVDLIRKLMLDDGEIKSIFFDFTEVSDRVLSFNFPKERLENWFFLNSTHILDLAFSLCGWPKELHATNFGQKSWHGEGDVFSGFGVSEKNIPFSYHSNWNAPGRWSVEVMTEKRRFILKPLEEIHVQLRNEFKYEKITFEKPVGIKDGILEIVEAAVAGDYSNFVTFSEQLKHLEVFESIRSGRSFQKAK